MNFDFIENKCVEFPKIELQNKSGVMKLWNINENMLMIRHLSSMAFLETKEMSLKDEI